VAISYSLGNLLELKHFSRRDTTERQEKKIRIFDNLAFSGFYSLTADSLKWSEVRTGGLFRLFKGVSTLTWNATFDPYIADERGQRINRFMVNEKGRLLRTSRLGIQLNTSFRISELRSRLSNRGDARGEQPTSTPRAPAAISDDFLGWIGDFNVVHRISYERQLIPTGVGTGRDTFVIGTNSLSVNGSIPLSSKWRINLNNISYDFKSKSLVYPDLGFTRDLHCWELSLSWQPVRGTYLFSLNVKPGSLDFLKIPYRKNNADARLSF
jgi:hypothetical protein